MFLSAVCPGTENWVSPAGWESGLCPVAYFSFDDPNSYTWMKESGQIDPPESSQVEGVVSVILEITFFKFPFGYFSNILYIDFHLQSTYK